jgi:hypothetical protein
MMIWVYLDKPQIKLEGLERLAKSLGCPPVDDKLNEKERKTFLVFLIKRKLREEQYG